MINNRIYLKNLEHFNNTSALIYTQRKLLELLSEYGIVKKIEISIDKDFGFIEMSTSAEARNAKKHLNGLDFNGQKLIAVDKF